MSGSQDGPSEMSAQHNLGTGSQQHSRSHSRMTTESNILQSPLSPQPLCTIPQFALNPLHQTMAEPAHPNHRRVELIIADYPDTDEEVEQQMYQEAREIEDNCTHSNVPGNEGHSSDPKDVIIHQLQQEIARLRLVVDQQARDLAQFTTIHPRPVSPEPYSDNNAYSQNSSMDDVMAVRTNSDGFLVKESEPGSLDRLSEYRRYGPNLPDMEGTVIQTFNEEHGTNFGPEMGYVFTPPGVGTSSPPPRSQSSPSRLKSLMQP